MKTLFAFSTTKKNLPCNKFFLNNPSYRKHIEARMNMVHKTAKQFYIRNTHYRMLASWYAYLLSSHPVARALVDMQGITKSSGKTVSEKPRFLEKGRVTERYESGSQDQLSMSEVREDAGWTPCVINRLLIVTSFGSPGWTFPATTRLTAECSGASC